MKTVNNAFAGNKLQAVIFSVCVFKCACVIKFVITLCYKPLVRISPSLHLIHLGTQMNCLYYEFRGQKGQSHSQTKCGHISTLGGTTGAALGGKNTSR